MNYQITVHGMHCNGCKALVAMSLTDANFQNIVVDLEKGTATFTVEGIPDQVQQTVVKVFEELPDHQFSDFKTLP